ncbi:hypothetical protein JAAARDRAFT_626256 [Jaapia argillacea MUCL 33604]|uniref:DUF7330 domain-containing protein n=1 Tax=Jaapia argillacea MUCL 33604 TaxID=933084 RepID=A0A067Q7X8_9AGAM|nr:hypothetical protein JAAARDRAFT_626256 [Jaapia argillacea MUCL 33604]
MTSRRRSMRDSVVSALSIFSSNLSSIGAHRTPRYHPRRITEQLLPVTRPNARASFYNARTRRPSVDAVATRERLELRVLLLSPFPSDLPPFAKSVVNVSSQSGSISVKVYRLGGAASTHFFKLHITAHSSNVVIILPSSFRGGIFILGQTSSRHQRIWKDSAVRRRIRRGLIRLNGDPDTAEDEDEVVVRTKGRVRIQIVNAAKEERARVKLIDWLKKRMTRRSISEDSGWF